MSLPAPSKHFKILDIIIVNSFFFLKIRLLISDREEGREGETSVCERNTDVWKKHQSVAPLHTVTWG